MTDIINILLDYLLSFSMQLHNSILYKEKIFAFQVIFIKSLLWNRMDYSNVNISEWIRREQNYQQCWNSFYRPRTQTVTSIRPVCISPELIVNELMLLNIASIMGSIQAHLKDNFPGTLVWKFTRYSSTVTLFRAQVMLEIPIIIFWNSENNSWRNLCTWL